MKWALLGMLLCAAITLANWLRANPKDLPKVGILMGCLPFLVGPFHMYMAIVSWPDWPGYVKGMEFSALDAVALAVLFALPRVNYNVPFRLPMALYFIASLISVTQTNVPVASLFYCWQLLRMYIVYLAIANACLVPNFTSNVLKGLAVGLSFEAFTAGWEHFVLGNIQATGTEAHQNTLGLISHLVAFPFFALLLAGRTGWLPLAVVFAGVVVEVSTTSRATVGLAAAGYVGYFLVSGVRQWTGRKAAILLVGSALAIAVIPLVVYSFGQRFAAEQREGLSSDYDERAAFEKAASMIFADHPLGVGVNQYVVIANMYGYNKRAGVVVAVGSLSANVHNVFRLILAESGVFGLASMLLLLARGFLVAALCGWRNRRDPRGDLLLGISVGLLVFDIHCQYEWVFVTFELQYLYVLELGLVAGLSQQLGYWARKSRHTGFAVRVAA